jgi:hypothetical protein
MELLMTLLTAVRSRRPVRRFPLVRTARRWVYLLAAACLVAVALASGDARAIHGTGSIFDEPEPGKSPPSSPRPKPPAPKPPTPPTPGELKPPAPAAEVAPGLVAEAFQGTGFTRSREKRVTSNISVTLRRDANAPPPKPTDSIPHSFRWAGLVKLPQTGKYHFQVPVASDAAVSVGGRTVLRQARDKVAGGSFPQAAAELPAGYQELKVEVSNIAAAAGAVRVQVLFGAGATPQMQPLPAALLYHKPADDSSIELTWGGGNDGKSQTTPGPRPRPGSPAVENGPPPAPARVAVPPDAAVNDARKAVRAKYASYYAEKKPAIQASLLKKLRDEAEGPTLAAAERYALLREAAEVAAAAGDVEAALAAVRTTSERFQVDETELSVAVLASPQRAVNKENAAQWGEAALRLAEAASESARYDLAAKAVTVAEAAARAMPGGAGASIAERAKERSLALKDLRAEQGRLAAMFERLKTKPEDPEANLRVGKFYCLVAGDWTRGLAALAKGSDLELRALAELETAAQQDLKAGKKVDPAERIKIGDLWYDRVKSERDIYPARCRQRAAYWYKPAIESAGDRDTKDRLWDRCAEARGVVNLLAMADLKRDVAQGARWEWRKGDLWCHGDATNALQFPYKPATEYNYLVEYSVTAGNGIFHQIIPVGTGAAIWVVTPTSMYWNAAFSGGTSRLAGGSIPKQRHTLLVKVRRGLIRVYYDGQLASEWERDASAIRGAVELPNAALGVGSYETTFTVHKAQLTEVKDDEPAASKGTPAARTPGNTGPRPRSRTTP